MDTGNCEIIFLALTMAQIVTVSGFLAFSESSDSSFSKSYLHFNSETVLLQTHIYMTLCTI